MWICACREPFLGKPKCRELTTSFVYVSCGFTEGFISLHAVCVMHPLIDSSISTADVGETCHVFAVYGLVPRHQVTGCR